jgi:hypothetical protein
VIYIVHVAKKYRFGVKQQSLTYILIDLWFNSPLYKMVLIVDVPLAGHIDEKLLLFVMF